MTKRKSFILHLDSLDVLDELSDEQAGMLFKAISAHHKGDDYTLNGLLNAVYIPFKNQFDRDEQKYQNICNRNKNNGLKGGRPKTQETQSVNLGSSGNPNKPKKPDNDSKSDNDNKNNIPPIIPQGVDADLWNDFLKLRKSLRAKNTPRALNLLTSKIEEITNKGYNPNTAIENSIENSWKTVYEPKGNNNAQKSITKSVADEFIEELEAERATNSTPDRTMLCSSGHLWEESRAIENIHEGDD